jgi:hypothetical protein
MSVEITLYPKTGSKAEIRRLVDSLGAKGTTHLWDWPQGSLHFHWYDSTDFKSADGVEITIYPLTPDEQVARRSAAVALHTRTRIAASSFDREQQNLIIRTARRSFGGWFYNDWHGTNRYTPVEADIRTPQGRGIALAYEFVTTQVRSVRATLPAPSKGFPTEGKLATLARLDPTRVLYNALVPFVVATLEHFFSETFKILVRYDDKAQKKLAEQNRRVDIKDLLAVAGGSKRVEDIVAEGYSFQSLDSIHAAFKDWLGIDIRRLLRRRRKIAGRIAFLDEAWERLIDRRHDLVHRFEIDRGLSREQIDQLLAAALLLIDTITEHLEQDRGVTIFEPWARSIKRVASKARDEA